MWLRCVECKELDHLPSFRASTAKTRCAKRKNLLRAVTPQKVWVVELLCSTRCAGRAQAPC